MCQFPELRRTSCKPQMDHMIFLGLVFKKWMNNRTSSDNPGLKWTAIGFLLKLPKLEWFLYPPQYHMRGLLVILSHPFLSSPLHCAPLPGLQSLEITYGLEAKKALGPVGMGKHYVATTKEEASRLRSKKCWHHPQCPYCTIVPPYPWGRHSKAPSDAWNLRQYWLLYMLFSYTYIYDKA